jgi:acyl-coenzyme A thioesterase PaaI-like protein
MDDMVAQAIGLAPLHGGFGLQTASRLMLKVVAPWIQDLGLLIEHIEAVRPAGAPQSWQPRAVLRLPYSQKLCCGRDAISAPALTALADTAMMFACAAAWNGYRPMHAIDQTAQFTRPVRCDVLADARVVGAGPATVFTRATLISVADDHPVGTIAGVFGIS